MPNKPTITKPEITDWLKAIGKDRDWLASQLIVSLSIVNQWLAPKGVIPKDRLLSIEQLMAREANPSLIGDPEGNLVSFTLDEFERIEATRQRLHYESRPPMYRDAILAFLEADEATQSKITTMPTPAASAGTLDKAAETPISPLVTEIHRPVHYTPKKP